MRMMAKLLHSLPLLLLAAPGWGQTEQPYPPCLTPVIELRVDTPTVKRGSAPTFTVVLRNEGKKQIRILDMRKPELRNASLEVQFLRNGNVLHPPVWLFADPGPIDSRHDYLLLPAGGEVRVNVTNNDTDATQLLPDDYEVRVVFQNFPAPADQKCSSSRAKFTVK
jgi:hypothetical protein